LAKCSCHSLSKIRAKLENLCIPVICTPGTGFTWQKPPLGEAIYWEFPPYAASAILQRNIDIRRTGANLVRAAIKAFEGSALP
jgi:hypothetical protein